MLYLLMFAPDPSAVGILQDPRARATLLATVLSLAKSKTQTPCFQLLPGIFCGPAIKSENQLLCFHARAHDFVQIGGLGRKLCETASLGRRRGLAGIRYT